MTDRSDRAGGDGPTGVEAARIVEQYLTMRSTLDDGDAANIIHILSEAGVRFSSPSSNAGEGTATVTDVQWERALNCAHEIMQRDVARHAMQEEGPLPSKKILDNAMQHAFGLLSLQKVAAPPQPAPDALRMRKALQWISDQNDCDASAVQVSDLCLVAKNALSSAPVQSGVRGDREALARCIFKSRLRVGDQTADVYFARHASHPHAIDDSTMAVDAAFRDADAILQSTGDQRTPQVSGDGSR